MALEPIPIEAFGRGDGSYQLLPFRFARVPGIENEVLLVSDWGEWLFLESAAFAQFVDGRLPLNSEAYLDLAAKQFCADTDPGLAKRIAATKYAAKRSFLRHEPGLHIFVVTLRCNHSCQYCQVSRKATGSSAHDMSRATAIASIDRLFENQNQAITVEFQGGEPLIAFEMIRFVTEEIERRNQVARKAIRFTITSTLHHLTDEILEFFVRHQFHISTSIDGPAALHDTNRPIPHDSAYSGTLHGLAQAREGLGLDGVVALTTLTRKSLAHPEEIVDHYVELGFRSIFLRPLSPYGFARKSEARIGYPAAEYLDFYKRALAHIIELNRRGVEISEVYTSVLLRHMLTPWLSGYVDLRSPTGAGLGALVYNYDGSVYASDEARMLAEVDDQTFRLGSVHEPLSDLYRSEAMDILLAAGVAEALPGCSGCAFLPFCGADPVYHYATQGDPVGHRPSSGFCRRHMGMFEHLFRYLHSADPFVVRMFHRWAFGQGAKVLGNEEAA